MLRSTKRSARCASSDDADPVRVVLDTNVLVSALLNGHSTSGVRWNAIQDGSLTLISSASRLSELRAVLDDPKARSRLARHGVDTGLFLELLPLFAATVVTDEVAATRPRDPKDQHVLATRVASQADWLITADKDLRVLADRCPILSPTAFRDRFFG